VDACSNVGGEQPCELRPPRSPSARSRPHPTPPLHPSGHFSNALTLWLGIKPAPLFFFLFLPPLLLDSASRVDFFIFRKARRGGVGWGGVGRGWCWLRPLLPRARLRLARTPAPTGDGPPALPAPTPPQPPKPRPQIAVSVLVFAFANVIVAAFAMIPLLQYALGLADDGWRPIDVRARGPRWPRRRGRAGRGAASGWLLVCGSEGRRPPPRSHPIRQPPPPAPPPHPSDSARCLPP
jgi:hypothetical protein